MKIPPEAETATLSFPDGIRTIQAVTDFYNKVCRKEIHPADSFTIS